MTRIGDEISGPLVVLTAKSSVVADVLFDLSPIQPSYANFTLKGDNLSKQINERFNHNFCLTVKKAPRPAVAVREAIEALVKRHGMPRARFQQDATAACSWLQYISTGAVTSFHFCNWKNVTVGQVRPALEEARQSLGIEKGPILKVDFKHEQYPMVVAHQLIVDLVS